TFDERAPNGGGVVARWRAPDGMGKTGELALHPHELARVLERLLLGVLTVHLEEVAAVLGPRGEARFLGGLLVGCPDLLRGVERRVEGDVGVAVARRPDDGLAAYHPGDPDARMG